MRSVFSFQNFLKMKIHKLFNSFVPQRKCGADPVSAAIIAGGAGLAGNLVDSTLGYNQQRHMQNLAFDRQEAENKRSRDWQTAEAEKARGFIAQQQLKQNQFQQTLQGSQFGHDRSMQLLQAKLNSPVYQRAQLENAGINPQVYFGSQSSFGGSSAPTSGTPMPASVGSAPSAGGSSPGLSPIGFQPTKLAIGSLIKDLASSAKDLGDNQRAQAMLKEQIRSLSTQSDLNTVLKVGQDVSNYLAKQKLPLEYKKAVLDVRKAVSEIELNEANEISSRSQARVNDALEALHKAQSRLTDKEFQKLDIYVQQYPSILQQTINNMKSETARNYASAEEHRASARNQIEQSELTHLERIITRNTQGDIEERTHQELVNLQKQGKILGSDVRAAEAAAHQAEVAASHAEELFWKDFVLDVVRGGVDAFTSVRNSKSWANMSDASQRRVDAKLKEIENAYGDKVEITNTPHGTTKTRTYRRPYQKYGDSTD